MATLVTEGDWGHFRPDSPIRNPRWNPAQMADRIKRFAGRRIVPIFDLEIYQDGTVSPSTIKMFEQARQLLK
jgi:hypothetical protein